MLPESRTNGNPYSIPEFSVETEDIESFVDEMRAFHSEFTDCFQRSETRENFYRYMVVQFRGHRAVLRGDKDRTRHGSLRGEEVCIFHTNDCGLSNPYQILYFPRRKSYFINKRSSSIFKESLTIITWLFSPLYL